MKDAPNPCPYCNMHPVKVVSMMFGDEMIFKVGCQGCKANGPAADSDRTAVLLWNRVATVPKPPKVKA